VGKLEVFGFITTFITSLVTTKLTEIFRAFTQLFLTTFALNLIRKSSLCWFFQFEDYIVELEIAFFIS